MACRTLSLKQTKWGLMATNETRPTRTHTVTEGQPGESFSASRKDAHDEQRNGKSQRPRTLTCSILRSQMGNIMHNLTGDLHMLLVKAAPVTPDSQLRINPSYNKTQISANESLRISHLRQKLRKVNFPGAEQRHSPFCSSRLL